MTLFEGEGGIGVGGMKFVRRHVAGGGGMPPPLPSRIFVLKIPFWGMSDFLCFVDFFVCVLSELFLFVFLQ